MAGAQDLDFASAGEQHEGGGDDEWRAVVEQGDGAIGEVLAVDRSQIGLIGEGFFELCLLDGGLIVDGRLEVALEGFVGAAAAFGFVALAHQEVFAVFEVVDFVEAAAPDAAGVRDGDGADVADEEVHALEHQAAPRVLRVVAALAVAALRARVLSALPGVGGSLAGVMVLAVVGAVPAVCGAFTVVWTSADAPARYQLI
jgi:hypothetical protein